MTPEVIENEITQQLIRFSLQQIAEHIVAFARSIGDGSTDPSETVGDHERVVNLPTVGIIGIGRCGTNIALDVANTIYSANKSTDNAGAETESAAVLEVVRDEQTQGWKERWRERLRKLRSRKKSREQGGNGGLFLIDPVILAADLDGDTSTRITRLNPELVRNFKHFKVTDLQWLYSGGAGNIPVVGQYMATLALIAGTDSAPDTWKQHRSYIIDSSGLTINRSRLYFYLFSCGGGSGSGMASVFGISQQRARIVNIERRAVEDKTDGGSNVSEPICSVGIGVLPDVPGEHSAANAQHYNAGRLLCAYLAQKNRFDLKFRAGDTSAVMMFNCLLLVSNDIMKYALSEADKNLATTAVKAEQMANHYIAQQIFNLLTAQASIQDYSTDDPKFIQSMKSAGISLGDTVKLDASDLSNCLGGPAVVGYSEQLDEKEGFDRLFGRAISPPKTNKDHVIEGLSVLPCSFKNYEKIGEALSGGNVSAVKDLPLFKHASSVVVIVAAPRGDSLAFSDMTMLKTKVDQCFPAARIKRYAFVLGTSRRCSLTLLISGSACSTLDVFYPLTNYIFGAFVPAGTPAEKFSEDLDALLSAPEFDSTNFGKMLRDEESLSNVLVGAGGGGWELQKLGHEQKFASFAAKTPAADSDSSGRIEPKIPLDDMLLRSDDVIEALHYIHRLEHHVPTPTVRPTRYTT